MASKDFQQQAWATIDGMIALAGRHDPDRVEHACRRALGSGCLSLKGLKAWLLILSQSGQ